MPRMLLVDLSPSNLPPLPARLTPHVLGDPPPARCAHTATLVGPAPLKTELDPDTAPLAGDRILVLGGYGAKPLGDAWFLEVATPYVKEQAERQGGAVAAWSRVTAGTSLQVRLGVTSVLSRMEAALPEGSLKAASEPKFPSLLFVKALGKRLGFLLLTWRSCLPVSRWRRGSFMQTSRVLALAARRLKLQEQLCLEIPSVS